jgi:galactose-1-phosphate uridylyltransferase
VLGQHVLDELLSERDKINAILQEIIDEATSPWGIKVSIVEVKDVEIPTGMQRAMARQAEAERERRAKVIAAEGEFQASERLKDAANVMSENPITLQLRFLQTVLEMSSERTSTLILPLPLELLRVFASGPPNLTDRRDSPELRRDPVSGRWVVIAPARARRPGCPAADRRSRGRRRRLPFCAGGSRRRRRRPLRSGPRGDLLMLRLVGASGAEQVPRLRSLVGRGGRTGLFARRAARGRQEVVIHSPRHVRTFADLTGREVEQVAEAWQNRAAAAKEHGFPYLQALLNEGASRSEPRPQHSQLVWLEGEPPLVAQERVARKRGRLRPLPCLAEEIEQRMRIVAERDGLLLLCPFAGRQPYEMLVVPREHAEDPFEGPQLAVALGLLADGLRRLHAREGPAPVNAWLHASGHWHLEIVPRSRSSPASSSERATS